MTVTLARRRRAALSLAATLLATPAFGQGTSEVSAWGSSGAVFEQQVVNGPAAAGKPGAIDLSTWSGGQHHFAAASGAHQTLRAVAAGSGGHDDTNQVSTSSAFSWTVQVGAGSSGLAAGAPVTVHFDLRVDGTLAAGFAPAFSPAPVIFLPLVYQLDTQAGVSLSYLVYDLSGDFEEGAPDMRFDFSANAVLRASAFNDPAFEDYVLRGYSQQASASLQRGAGWQWTGNATDQTVTRWDIPGKQTLEIDTGLQRFTFDTFVGHTLRLDAEMTSTADAYVAGLGWKASADFGKTFDAAIGSDVAGLEFSSLQPGVFAPVPEPAPALLLLAGAVMLRFARAFKARPLHAAPQLCRSSPT